MNLSYLPNDIKRMIMFYLSDNIIIHKELYKKELKEYYNIYNTITKQETNIYNINKAYSVYTYCPYKRKRRMDYQIVHYNNYIYMSKYDLKSGTMYGIKGIRNSPYLRPIKHTLNFFINEIIKLRLKKHNCQKYYEGDIFDRLIDINISNGYRSFDLIDENSIVQLNTFDK